MSGYEKSKINKIRYCLHQMSQEMDHTQALIDFVLLVFEIQPIEFLVGKEKAESKLVENDKESK